MSAKPRLVGIFKTYHFLLKLQGPEELHQILSGISCRMMIKPRPGDLLAHNIAFEFEMFTCRKIRRSDCCRAKAYSGLIGYLLYLQYLKVFYPSDFWKILLGTPRHVMMTIPFLIITQGI